MKAATVNEIKQELSNLPAQELTALCLRLAKFKKENKELLTYLLFEAYDEQGYIQNVKQEMDELFAEVNQSNLYFAKKTLRKILRITGKHIRYIGSVQAEAELLIYFCTSLKNSGIEFTRNAVLNNLYRNQLKKTEKVIASMHEDLQYDYKRQCEQLGM